jgi:hypothetical protein
MSQIYVYTSDAEDEYTKIFVGLSDSYIEYEIGFFNNDENELHIYDSTIAEFAEHTGQNQHEIVNTISNYCFDRFGYWI